MFFKIFLLLLCLYLIKGQKEIEWNKFHQSDYDVVPHRVEIPWYNKSYGNIEHCELKKYNRSVPRSLYAAGEVIREFDNTLMARLEAYKLLSNRYMSFPRDVRIDVCKEYKRNTLNIGTYLSKYSNVKECPPKKGYLEVHGIYLDADLLPPFVPRGDYKLTAKVTSGDDHLLTAEVYGSIVDKPGHFGLFLYSVSNIEILKIKVARKN